MEVFDSKGLEVSFMKHKVMFSGCITIDGLSVFGVFSCGVCRLKVDSNSFLCVKCDRWIPDRRAGMIKVNQNFKKFRLQQVSRKHWIRKWTEYEN